MDDGTEREAVAKRSGHVGDLDVSVAQSHVLAPLLQSLNSRLPRHESAPLIPKLQRLGKLAS